MQSPLDFVKEQGWEYKITGDQINLKTCPLCKKSDWKFYINVNNGLWDCKHLNSHSNIIQKGNLFQLKKALGLILPITKVGNNKIKPLPEKYEKLALKYHNNLINTKFLLQILLDEWKINEKIVKLFKLGYVEENNKAYLTIPHYVDVTGGNNYKLYDIKKRIWFDEEATEGKYRRIKDATNVMFRETILHRYKVDKVLICEGEKDTIIATACGIPYAVGLTNGATGLDDRWVKLLDKAEKIIIALDNDDAGRKGTEKILDRLGRHRCFLVDLPDKYDLHDYYKEVGANGIKRLINNAKQPGIPAVSTAREIVEQFLQKDNDKTYPLYLKNFSKLLNGGFREGQLITLTGVPKSGKTTLSLNIAIGFAKQNIPTLFYCMEMPPTDIYSMATGIYYGIGRTPSKIDYLNFACTNIPFYFGYQGDMTIKQLEHTFRDVSYRYGCKLYVFDNIQYMSRNIPANGNKVEFIENLYKTLKVLSIELKAFIIAIAQPKKMDLRKSNSMNYYDIAWTGSAASDSDTIIVVHRNRSESDDSSFEPIMDLKIDAGRYTRGGKIKILFLEDNMLFMEKEGEEQNE